MPQEKQTELITTEQSREYDFRRCKLCGTYTASPKYRLKKTTVYACAACGFHFIDHLDTLTPESPPLDRKAWDVNFPGETLENAFNVLKPGGWLFLDTPRRDALFYRASEWSYRLSSGTNPPLLESLYSPLPFRHKQIFTRRQLLNLMEKIGFSVIRTHASLLPSQNKMVLVCRKP